MPYDTPELHGNIPRVARVGVMMNQLEESLDARIEDRGMDQVSSRLDARQRRPQPGPGLAPGDPGRFHSLERRPVVESKPGKPFLCWQGADNTTSVTKIKPTARQ